MSATHFSLRCPIYCAVICRAIRDFHHTQKKGIETYGNPSPSYLYTAVCICAENAAWDATLSSVFHSFFLHFAPVFHQESCRVSCSCSACINKDRALSFSQLQCANVSDYLDAWSRAIHCFPIAAQQSILPHLLLLMERDLAQTSLHPSLFVLELFQFCFSRSGHNCVLDGIELLWNTNPSPSTLALLSALLAHTSSLSTPEILSILVMLWREASPSISLLHLTLHVLWVRLSLHSADSSIQPSLEDLLLLLQHVPVALWDSLPFLLVHAVGCLLARQCPSLRLCCGRWRVHLCPACLQQLSHVAEETLCPVCVANPALVRASFVRNPSGVEKVSGCDWVPGEPHVCPCCGEACEYGMCGCVMGGGVMGDSGKGDGRKCDGVKGYGVMGDGKCDGETSAGKRMNDTNTCYCARGCYVLSYDYSISDDSSSEMEDKRLCLDVESIRRAVDARKDLSADEWLHVTDYCDLHSLIVLSATNSRLQQLCANDWVWKTRYRRLFRHFRCKHSRRYEHRYEPLLKKRLHSLRKLKPGEVICQYCGCAKRFENRESYREHVESRHLWWCLLQREQSHRMGVRVMRGFSARIQRWICENCFQQVVQVLFT